MASFDQCMAEAIAEYVRAWFDQHPEALATQAVAA